MDGGNGGAGGGEFGGDATNGTGGNIAFFFRCLQAASQARHAIHFWASNNQP
jgi:hypothetical protein